MNTDNLQTLAAALREIGRNDNASGKVIALCKSLEQNFFREYVGSVRDDITGPIVDAMYDENTRLRKVLADGTIIDFLYRTKIARDFVMSSPTHPDHVWEPQTTKLLLQLSKGAGEALVGGAYFGDQAILIAKRLALEGGTCHAFEPNPDQLGMLRHNAEINGIRNIKSWPLGLWSDSNTKLRLAGYDSLAHSEQIYSADIGGGFATITIDDYCAHHQIGRLGLIMLDIEGAEIQVLKGAMAQLQRPIGKAPNIVFEVHSNYVDWSRGLENSEIVQLISSLGYQIFAVRDFHSNVKMAGRPIELITVDKVYLEGPPHGFNMVAVKDSATLSGPEFAFCEHVSPKLLWHREPALHHPIH